jgi:lysophospholipase L1-like esterase
LEIAVRFLALGDSYTIGEGVAETERWPAQLARRLRDRGVDVDELTIIAQTGWTTAELATAVACEEPLGVYDLVSLLIGVNNQYRGLSQESYRQEFVALLEQAIACAGGDSNRVIVLSIPDWGVTPFAAEQNRPANVVAAEIEDFNVINREEAARHGVHYVDVTATSRQASHDLSWLAADGLHPSAKMYTKWAELALAPARRALNGD